jgi:Replication-relaxation
MTDAVLRVQSHLTDRDHILLGWLADHGVLTSFQIAHALFPSIDFAQDRLRKLTNVGVLARFRPQKPDGGSYPYHYVLDQLGVEVVAAQRGHDLPRKDQARLRRWHLTNRANLPHLLGVNQCFIDLAGYARTHPGASLDRWWHHRPRRRRTDRPLPGRAGLVAPQPRRRLAPAGRPRRHRARPPRSGGVIPSDPAAAIGRPVAAHTAFTVAAAANIAMAGIMGRSGARNRPRGGPRSGPAPAADTEPGQRERRTQP